MIKYFVGALIISLLFLMSVNADPLLGEGCGAKGFYDTCSLDCSWSCNAYGQRVKTCYTANGWCEVDGQCTPCDFVETEGVECIIENRPQSQVADYPICEGDFPANKNYPQRYYQTNINYECQSGEWITRNEPVSGSSGSCTEELCKKQGWALDKDGDGYYSLEWTTDIYFVDGKIYDETCYPPPAIYNSAELTENQKEQFRLSLKNKCGDSCFTESGYWKPISSMNGKEPNCDSYDSACKNSDNNPNLNLETIFCKDEDGDLYGTDCLRRDSMSTTSGYIPEFELKDNYDCDDSDPSINSETLWKQDEDEDGYWGKVVRSCEELEGVLVSEMPDIEEYDCDDLNSEKTNPLDNSRDSSGVCSCEIEGSKLNGYVCVGSSDSIPSGIPVEFERSDSENKWAKTELKETTYCPEEMCYNNVLRECVKEGTFWTDLGSNKNVANERGNLFCAKGEDGKGIWTTRTAKIRSMLLEAVEKRGIDYTLYCDEFEYITHTLNSEFSDYIIRGHTYDLFYDDQEGLLGNGCILKTDSGIVIGIPYSGNLNGGHILNEYYDDLQENENWKNGENVFTYEPLKIAFVEKNEIATINAMKGNSIINNFISFLRNPLRKLNNNDVAIINDLILKKFDRSYLNKDKNSYWFSVVKDDNLYVKVTNQNNNVIKEIEKDCKNNCESMTTALVGKVPFEGEKLWQDYSRTLRITGSEGEDEFFSQECTEETVNECTVPRGCYIPVCGELGQCEFVFGGENSGLTSDGCCLPGSTKEEDVDCPAESRFINLQTIIKENELCDANDLFVASINEEGLLSETQEYENKICLHSSEINLNSGSTNLREECNTGETRLVGIENNLAFRDEKESICIDVEKPMECFVDVSCYGATEVFSISKDNYALSGVNQYERKVCCYMYDEELSRPSECDDHLDNDLNGLIDADDPNCQDDNGNWIKTNYERSNALNPTISTNCPPGKVAILSLSGINNAHLGSPSTYDYKLCVDEREHSITQGQICQNDLTSIIGMSSYDNAHAYNQGEGEYQVCTETESCTLASREECNVLGGVEVLSLSSRINFTPAYEYESYLVEETIEAGDLTQLSFETNGVEHDLMDDKLVVSVNFDDNEEIGDSSNLAKNNVGSNDLTVNGAQWSTQGKYDGGIYFDTNTDSMKLEQPISSSDLTVNLWYYYGGVGGGSWNTILAREAGGYHHLLILDSTQEIGFYRGGWYNSHYKLEIGNWYYLSLVKSGTNSKLYINGVLIQDRDDSFDNSNWPLSMIGNYDENQQQAPIGIIDELNIWERTLSADEINFMYNSSLKKVNSETWKLTTSHELTQEEKSGTFEYNINYQNNNQEQTINKEIQIAPIYNPDPIIGNSHVGDVDAYETKVCCDLQIQCEMMSEEQCQEIDGEEKFSRTNTEEVLSYFSDDYLIDELIEASDLTQLSFETNNVERTVFDENILLMLNFDNNECNSEQCEDLSLNSHSLDLLGNSEVIENFERGEVLSLDGSGDYLNLPLTEGFGLDKTSQFTISAWIYMNTETLGTIVSTGAGNHDAWVFGNCAQGDCRNDRFGLYRYGSSGGWDGVTDTEGFEPHTWYHVVGVYDGDSQKIYVNGELHNSYSRTYDTNYNPTNLRVGRRYYTGVYFDGKIDGLQIWDKALTDEEIEFMHITDLKKIGSSTWELTTNHELTQEEKSGTFEYNINYQNNNQEQTINKVIPMTQEITSTQVCCGARTMQTQDPVILS